MLYFAELKVEMHLMRQQQITLVEMLKEKLTTIRQTRVTISIHL